MTPEAVDAAMALEPLDEMPSRRVFGTSEIWRRNSTGTWDLYLLWVRVWRVHFTHSTGMFD